MADHDWVMEVSGVPASIDVAEVRRALGLFVDPDSTHELRGVPSGQSRFVRGSDLDAGVRAVEALAGNKGVYITLNPVIPTLGKAATNKDVVRRHHLLIDVDPVRPEGMIETNATEAEHEAARDLAETIREHLDRTGWPAPLVIDSGNGWHLVYRVDLPHDDLSRQWIRAALKQLSEIFDRATAKVDRTVHNASRITKLPGTWVRKGPHSPDRPHRMARLVSVPVALVPVQPDQIRELAGLRPPPRPIVDAEEPGWILTVGGEDRRAYAETALFREVERVTTAPEGSRNNLLNEAAFNLGQLVARGDLSRPDVETALSAAARHVGLSDDEIRKTIESGLTGGESKPRTTATQVTPKVITEDDLIIFGHEVEPESIEWYWERRIPRGFITMLAGQTGVGKSFTTFDILARQTNRAEMPDGLRAHANRNALIITEDPIASMAAPRLIELGADMSQIAFMRWEAMTHWTIDNTEMLERAWMKANQPDLVLIDPPTNFLSGKIDEHKNSAVRKVLFPLVQWLERRKVAGVLISHVNKQAGTNIEAINRVIGSVAWMTTARIGHAYAKDPNDPSRCLALPLKTNVGPEPTGLAYRIVGTDSLARIEWLGEVDITADEALAATKRKQSGQEDAVEFLLEQFRGKWEWASDDLIKLASDQGIKRHTLWRGSKRLEPYLKRRQVSRQWIWTIAPDAECFKDGWEPSNASDD